MVVPKLYSQFSAVDVKVLSSKLVKPAYNAGAAPATASADEYIPLSIFDSVTYKMQMAIIYAFPPPAPPSTATIENGLAAVLAEYRVFAGQLGEAPDGTPAVLLNDRGARFVEASVDANLVDMAPAKPTPELLRLHPDLEEELQEVVLLQLTRFRCGSLAVGFTSNHVVADGHATSIFLVAWGRATRGLPPVHHQAGLFKPSASPRVDFDHRSREWYRPSPAEKHGHGCGEGAVENIVIHKAHLTKDFFAVLRARASEGRGRPFSRFETILAHLSRTMSQIRLSVDGRHRLVLLAEYFGNLVLRAFPTATVVDLLGRPLKHAAQSIHDAVARADGAYFQSFVDFASSGAVEKEGLETTAVLKDVLCPDLEVDSWLTFPFYELDFGAGSPSYFMPSYFPTEGMLFLVPSYLGDGSVDAFVPVFEHNLEAFKQCCYSME
ncbi:putrescine hydroxycinnamoyltransferase 3-like [Miscanthus floridulus]|uniref:putrescine hydroxycinnamoyltransferase 3-like n=1 Tax=Miscanthus floridulus TaxID=154761 RepID=UPI00345925CF